METGYEKSLLLPRVSVVIPVRNRHAVLEEALHSVFGQTVPPDEVVIVDDASSPPITLPTFVKSNSRVRVLRLEKRAGAQRARLRGVLDASGDFIAFLDSDDIWFPRWLESQLGVVVNRREPTHWSVCRGWVQYFGEAEHLPADPRPDFDGTYGSALKKPATLGFSSLIASRSLLLKSKALSTKLPAYQEWETIIRLASLERGVINPERLFVWRISKDSISAAPRRGARARVLVRFLHWRDMIASLGLRTWARYAWRDGRSALIRP
jgi:glycosyltransferase involved in cell wall biosynthesis